MYGFDPHAVHASPPPHQRPTNSMAIAALVSSLLIAPLGIIFGHISLAQIKKSGENGHGLAIAGLVIGYVLTSLSVISLIAFLVLINSVSDSFEHAHGSTEPTTEAGHDVVGDASSTAIRSQRVGSCIHVDGSIPSMPAVEFAQCGSANATHTVTKVTDEPSECGNDWVRSNNNGPVVVLCLTKN